VEVMLPRRGTVVRWPTAPGPPDSGYPLGWESRDGPQSWVIVRRRFPDTRVTGFRLAA
jgi:hypothetical protein